MKLFRRASLVRFRLPRFAAHGICAVFVTLGCGSSPAPSPDAALAPALPSAPR